MKKGVFDMYGMATKEKENIYRSFTPSLKKYKEIESQIYIANHVSKDISNQMSNYVERMSRTIASSIMRGKK